MQKKLIAAAVASLLAAPVFAQSNVTISGLVKMGYEQYKITSPLTGTEASTENRISDQSSRIIFSGTEDLGGGMKAWFQLDGRWAPDQGSLGGTGNSGVGLMGSWGKLTLGRWDVHYGENGGLESNRAGSLQTYLTPGMMSQVNGTTIANGTRTPNLVMWDSPSWNGVTARLAWAAAGVTGNEGTGVRATGTANPGGGDAWTGAIRYANGPWAAGLSYWTSDNEAKASTGDQRSTRLYFGWAGPVKVGFVYDKSKISSGSVSNELWTERSAWMIPFSYAFGPHAVYLTYARAGNVKGSAVAAGTDAKARAWNVGYDYALSKRTAAGVYYTKYSNNTHGSYDMFALGANGATATNASEDSRQWYFGLAHSF